MKKLYFIILLLLSLTANAQDTFTIYFDSGKDTPNAKSASELAIWIKDNKTVIIYRIDGFADTVGDSVTNRELSQRRANNIGAQLKTGGIPIARDALIKGLGENSGWASYLERRVAIYYELQEKEILLKPIAESLEYKVTIAKKGDKIVLGNLNFVGGTDEVLPASRPVLAELLEIMHHNPKLKIEIQGHVCCRKDDDNNVALRRALKVYNYLAQNGIEERRLSYKTFEGRQPLYSIPEKNEAEKVANRRVEIEIKAN
jgi:outer membrane protein OmpA-like peptidoglycan-associated protein